MTTRLADITGAILAGGLGTRLRSVVADVPKVLAPVRGRPYLVYLLDQLAGAGVREVVLLTGYRADQVRTAFGEHYGGLRLVYSPEPAPLGTGGALRLALPLIASAEILLLNGDSYCDVDLPAFRDFHVRQGAEVSMVLHHVADSSRYGKVQVRPDGEVMGFQEKRPEGGEGWINAGVYLLGRGLVEEIPPDRPAALERDQLPTWAGRRRFFGYTNHGRFLDIGTPESYQEAERFFAPPERGFGEPGA